MSDQEEKTISDDFEYSRRTYYDLIEKGQTALEQMIDVAQAIEHPRAYEVVSGMIKNISDVNDRLMDLHKKKVSMKKDDDQPKQITNNNTSVFIGSTTDLQKIINDMNESEAKIINDVEYIEAKDE